MHIYWLTMPRFLGLIGTSIFEGMIANYLFHIVTAEYSHVIRIANYLFHIVTAEYSHVIRHLFIVVMAIYFVL